MLRRLQKAGKRFVQLQSFIRIPKKHFYRFEIPSKLPSFSSHLFFRQSWTKALGHFCVSGAFSNSHRSNPSLTPQTVLHVCTQNKCGIHSRYIFSTSCNLASLSETTAAFSHWVQDWSDRRKSQCRA